MNYHKLHELHTVHIYALRVRVCEQACVCTRVAKRSLIFGRISSKLCKYILRDTANCKGYVVFIFTQHLACVIKRSLILRRIPSKFGKNRIMGDHNLHGIYTLNVHVPHERVLTKCAWIRLIIFGRILSKFGGNILHNLRSYMGYLMCV
jgi:hypothetical protein